MILRDFAFNTAAATLRSTLAQLDEQFNDLRNILNKGLRIEDQLPGDVKTLRLNTSQLPSSVYVDRAPRAVLVLSATKEVSDDGQQDTGNRISWEHRGGLLHIHAVDGLAAATAYTLELLILEK